MKTVEVAGAALQSLAAMELRQWDAWVETNVFGRTDVKVEPDGTLSWDADKRIPRNFTSDRTYSDVLDDEIIRKLPIGYDVCFSAGAFWMSRPDQDTTELAMHADKKVCRVLFAMKLWGSK